MVYLVVASVGSFSCIMGALRNTSAPIHHDSLHSSPFYLKGPRTAATEKLPETRGHPGCNDKSKNYPRAHKRRIKPPQALSFRYPWDSVSRSHQTLCHPLHPQCTNYLFWSKTPLSSLSIISFPQVLLNNKYMSRWVGLTFPFSPKYCHYAPCFPRVPNTSPTALYLLPGMPVTPRADKISHGLCLFLCYLYTFTMIPFFALLAPDHELPSIWLPTNTIKLISIPPLIFDAPLLLGISCPLNDLLTQFLGPLWNLSVLTQLQPIVVCCDYHPF